MSIFNTYQAMMGYFIPTHWPGIFNDDDLYSLAIYEGMRIMYVFEKTCTGILLHTFLNQLLLASYKKWNKY